MFRPGFYIDMRPTMFLELGTDTPWNDQGSQVSLVYSGNIVARFVLRHDDIQSLYGYVVVMSSSVSSRQTVWQSMHCRCKAFSPLDKWLSFGFADASFYSRMQLFIKKSMKREWIKLYKTFKCIFRVALWIFSSWLSRKN